MLLHLQLNHEHRWEKFLEGELEPVMPNEEVEGAEEEEEESACNEADFNEAYNNVISGMNRRQVIGFHCFINAIHSNFRFEDAQETVEVQEEDEIEWTE